jgi:hypothetical protein
MKLLLLILLLLPCICHAQNSVCVLLQTSNRAPGIRYDHRFGRTGFYVMATQGTYRSKFFEPLKEQTISAGVIRLNEERKVALTGGISYNRYNQDWCSVATDPISIEFGTSVYFKRMVVVCSTDIIKWKLTMGIGVNF